MESLPSLGSTQDELTEKMRYALLLAEQTFQLEHPPPAPASGTVQELESWSTHELGNWLERKNHLVEAARAELNVAAEQTSSQRVVAGALVGLMYEDVARVLLSVPMPRELESDREIADAYRYVVEAQASPYLEHARAAYRACTLNGLNVEMRDWSRYCSARRELLPLSHNEQSEQSAEGTHVEVLVD